MRILFMGTPDIAVKSLCAILEAGHDVAAVATQPDRKAGRGHKLTPSPVKAKAQSLGIPVIDLPRICCPEGLQAVRALRVDAAVTVAFGQILTPAFLDILPLGTINLHGSLLPAYRGSAPIQWAIIRGETVTGVTTMYTAAGVDTGDVLLQRKMDILPQETAGQLMERMGDFGAPVLVESLRLLEAGAAPRIPQDESKATHIPMLTKESARLDWTRPARELANLVRGTNPWPLAHTTWKGNVLRVHAATAVEGEAAPPGSVMEAGKRLCVATGEGWLRIDTLQAPSTKAMAACAFVQGREIAPGDTLGV